MNETSRQGTTASKPLFRDPVFDGAADPVVIWNRQERKWCMFYEQRRSSIQVVELKCKDGEIDAERDQPTYILLQP